MRNTPAKKKPPTASLTFADFADPKRDRPPAPPSKKLVKVKLRESPSLPLPPPPISFARASHIEVAFAGVPYSVPVPSPAPGPSHSLAGASSWGCARCEGETDPERRTSIAAFDYLGREIQGSALPLCHFCLATIRACLEKKTRLTPVFAPLTPVCKRCKGTGKHGPWGDSDRDADEEQTCLHCRGTGREIVR